MTNLFNEWIDIPVRKWTLMRLGEVAEEHFKDWDKYIRISLDKAGVNMYGEIYSVEKKYMDLPQGAENMAIFKQIQDKGLDFNSLIDGMMGDKNNGNEEFFTVVRKNALCMYSVEVKVKRVYNATPSYEVI